jgi:hypothetical protein
MPYLLLVADPEENDWNVIAQANDPDKLLDEIAKHDPSYRIVINTDNYITFDTTEETDNGTR